MGSGATPPAAPQVSAAKAWPRGAVMGNKVSLENELVNLRLTSKQMQRSAIKCTKNETAAKAKLREAIKAGNIEGARIYGQNAIREKNQSLNCLRLSSRIDAVGSRLETAIRMKQVRDLGRLLRRLHTDSMLKHFLVLGIIIM